MFKRHFLSLLITLGIYYIPPMLYHVTGLLDWINSAFWSGAYIYLIYKYSKIRLMPLLLTAESIALLCMSMAFLEHHVLKSDWFFYPQYELVINACFAAELIVITVGVLNGGAIKRFQRLWHLIRNSNSHRRSFLFPEQKLI